jgi:hypothetical protein
LGRVFPNYPKKHNFRRSEGKFSFPLLYRRKGREWVRDLKGTRGRGNGLEKGKGEEPTVGERFFLQACRNGRKVLFFSVN